MRFALVLLVVLVAASCRQAEPKAEYRPVATVREIMDGMIDPSADGLWESVATIVTPAGTEERAPHTDDEWAAMKRHALQIVEASNLLLMPGRAVAHEGDTSSNPGIELSPAEIQPLIDRDRAAWIERVRALHDAVMPALAAIQKKDAVALSNAGEGLDTACENCHLRYWYPNAPKPPAR
jgi:hypothetical protein